MRSRERRRSLGPVRMERVALVGPAAGRPEVLAVVARSAAVELDLPYQPGTGPEEITQAAESAVVSGRLAGLVGWVPVREVAPLTAALAPLGGAVVPLTRPRGTQPPTFFAGPHSASVSRTLVDTYGTVPYDDVDPSRWAGLAYVVMFGMMFGDVGHGAILLGVGLLLRTGRIRRLAALRRAWAFVAGAGLAAMGFGALYGEAFGPTGLVPVLWVDPLADPIPVLVGGVVLGAVLLLCAYVFGTVNRVREGGWGYALYARTGLGGSLLFVAVALLALGVVAQLGPVLVVVAASLVVGALAVVYIGLLVEAGGGGAGAVQAAVELVDTVIRLGSNVISFARLAAFGLTHAALLSIVWDGTTALWVPGWQMAAAVLLFAIGNLLTFALEALVAGVQALRLEYYELFSRSFQSEGRQFRPWAPALWSASDEPPRHSEPASDRSPGTTHEGQLS